MYNSDPEIPLAELRRQLDYAQTVSSDIFRIYSRSTPDLDLLLNEYAAVSIKLSMLLDFIFQAKLWCDSIDSNAQNQSKQRRKNENKDH